MITDRTSWICIDSVGNNFLPRRDLALESVWGLVNSKVVRSSLVRTTNPGTLLVMNRNSNLIAETRAIKLVRVPLFAWELARFVYATMDRVIRKKENFIISVSPNNLCQCGQRKCKSIHCVSNRATLTAFNDSLSMAWTRTFIAFSA
jgi:hypothetical protein